METASSPRHSASHDGPNNPSATGDPTNRPIAARIMNCARRVPVLRRRVLRTRISCRSMTHRRVWLRRDHEYGR